MKSLLPILAGILFATARITNTAEPSNSFHMEVAPGLELVGQLDVINAVGNLWKPLAQKLEISDEGFAGTLVTTEGKEIEFEGSFKKVASKWNCSIKWKSDSDTPSTFILFSYVLPLDQVENAELRSDTHSISFAKMIEKTPTLTNLAGASEFTLGPIDNSTVQFTLGSPMDVQAVQLGEKMSVRILMSPQKEPLPASGNVEWTLEKQQ